MCALFPPIFASAGWPRENNSVFYHQYYTAESIEAAQHILPSHQPLPKLDRSLSFSTNSEDPAATKIKKLNHNASERERRKKMNSLYLSLRSLLPVTDQTKRLSIPATVSQVLKYIPELQHQVERLVRKKERLLSIISKQDDLIHQEPQRKNHIGSYSSSISVNRLADNEISVQISANNKADKGPPSEILFTLEEDGLVLINATSFESFTGRVFYNLHLQVERNYKLECDALTEKLLKLFEKRDDWFV